MSGLWEDPGGEIFDLGEKCLDFEETLGFFLIERNIGSTPRNYSSWRGLRSIIPNYFEVKTSVLAGLWPTASVNMSTS